MASQRDENVPSPSAPARPWICPRCAKTNGPRFRVCWNCGTSQAGRPDPEFTVEPETVPSPPEEPLWSAPQFSLGHLMVLTTVVALVLSVSSTLGGSVGALFACALTVLVITQSALRDKDAAVRRTVMTVEVVVVLALFAMIASRPFH